VNVALLDMSKAFDRVDHTILFSTLSLMQHGLIHKNVTFLKNLQKFHSQQLVIGYLVRHSGKNELHELSDIL